MGGIKTAARSKVTTVCGVTVSPALYSLNLTKTYVTADESVHITLAGQNLKAHMVAMLVTDLKRIFFFLKIIYVNFLHTNFIQTFTVLSPGEMWVLSDLEQSLKYLKPYLII